MSDTSATTPRAYTLDELAELLGVDRPDAVTILEEHGYPAPDGDERLPLTAEEYRELVVPAPPVGEDDPA